MATVTFRFQNAKREPLDDTIYFDLSDTQTGVLASSVRDVSGKKQLKVTKLNPGRTYRVRAFPKRYRPVSQFISTSQSDDPTDVTMFWSACALGVPSSDCRAACWPGPDRGAGPAGIRTVS